jgi:hypothetical protein
MLSNNHPTLAAEYPAEVTITVNISPSQLLLLEKDTTRIVIDSRTLQEGPHHIVVKPESIILPDGIKVVHCNPIFILHKKYALEG